MKSFPVLIAVLIAIAEALTPAQVKQFVDSNQGLVVTVPDTAAQNVSTHCKTALLNLTEKKVFTYLDSTGKPASGFTNGDMLWTGDFAGCLKMASSHYCLTRTSISHTKASIVWGVCLPVQCTESDVALGLETIVGELNLLVHDVMKQNISFYVSSFGASREAVCYQESKYTTGVILALMLITVLILLCLIGTTLDMVDSLGRSSQEPNNEPRIVNAFSPQENVSGDHAVLLTKDSVLATTVQFQKPPPDGLWKKVFLAFSLIRNTDTIMNTTVAANSITCINGIRVISMSWVILGHSFLFFLTSGIADNPVDAVGFLHSFSFMAVSNALFSVDSFFFLSGLLVGYLGWRRMEKNNGKLPLFAFYFHRFWRLTPVYMFVILFYDKLMGFLGRGPLWFSQQSKPNCDKYWWTNLLYINNFYPTGLTQECLGWSWYLANDMQFYIISPIILYAVYRWRWIGAGVTIGGLTAASIIVTSVIMYHYDFDALVISQLLFTSPFANHFEDYVYVKPYCRITPYLLGMFVGYLFHTDTNAFRWIWKILRFYGRNILIWVTWVFNVCGWMIAAGLAVAVVYGPYKEFAEDPVRLTPVENIFYGGFSRCVWAIALAWVVYACHNGFGGQINRFLSARFWIPLSRLTYGAYLLHPIILYALYSSFETPGHATKRILSIYFIGGTTLAYGAAFLMAIFIELPLTNLEKIVFKM